MQVCLLPALLCSPSAPPPSLSLHLRPLSLTPSLSHPLSLSHPPSLSPPLPLTPSPPLLHHSSLFLPENTLQINDELNTVFVRYERWLRNMEAANSGKTKEEGTAQPPVTEPETGVATTSLTQVGQALFPALMGRCLAIGRTLNMFISSPSLSPPAFHCALHQLPLLG